MCHILIRTPIHNMNCCSIRVTYQTCMIGSTLISAVFEICNSNDIVLFWKPWFSHTYKVGMVELMRAEPRRLLQMLTPSCPLLCSVLGLLPALLLESDLNVVFCKTPVGEDPTGGLRSHPSVIRLRADVLLLSPKLLLVLCKTSPRGPPIVFPQEMGTHWASLWLGSSRPVGPTPIPKPIWVGSSSRDNLKGERASFSLVGDEVEDMKSLGIEMESWVLSDCVSGQNMGVCLDWFLGKSSINWRRECCWDLVSGSLISFLQFMSGEVLWRGLRSESEQTSPNSIREDSSSYGFWCLGREKLFSVERPVVDSWIFSFAFALFRKPLSIKYESDPKPIGNKELLVFTSKVWILII